jgi:hypothetical protein
MIICREGANDKRVTVDNVLLQGPVWIKDEQNWKTKDNQQITVISSVTLTVFF